MKAITRDMMFVDPLASADRLHAFLGWFGENAEKRWGTPEICEVIDGSINRSERLSG